MINETVILLEVAGPSREEILGGGIPAGFAPMVIAADLATRIEPDGRLRVQVRPGSWELTINSRATTVHETLSRSIAEGAWSAEEIWSYQSNDRLRITALEGGSPVDPLQVDVPEDWEELPIFRVGAEDVLRIANKGEGATLLDSNRLSLAREIWLDFDNRGFTVRDNISGRMRQGWRLDMSTPYRMASATQDEENLLVTDGTEPGRTGVELRSPNVAVFTVGRIQSRDKPLLASGYTERFENLRLSLNLPPAYRLLAALGADQAPGAWLNRWRLLDLFLVLIIAVAVGQLINPWVGVGTLLTLVLTYHEPQAPVWSWLNLLVAIALARVAPLGWLKRIAVSYRNLSFVALLLLIIPFVANQTRLALYPQLERTPMLVLPAPPSSSTTLFGTGDPATSQFRLGAPESEPTPDIPASVQANRARVQGALDEIVVTARKRQAALSRYAPMALVQTGPGLPNWRWNRYNLAWSGPVEPEQRLSLVISPPWVTALTRVVGITLVVMLLATLLQLGFGVPKRLPWIRGSTPATLLLLAALLIAPRDGLMAQDEIVVPAPGILEELKNRLTRGAECAPSCADLASARVKTSADSLEIILQWHVLERVGVALPGSPQGWEPETARVDGTLRQQLYRDQRRQLWLILDPGVHQVRLTVPLPVDLDSVAIPFVQPPKWIATNGDGWEFVGINDQRLLAGSLELIRIKSDAASLDEPTPTTRVAPFVRVTRGLRFDLDWRVQTTVSRRAPARGAFTLEIPLLTRESVTSENVEVRDAHVLVAMSAGQDLFTWESILDQKDEIRLQAVATDTYTEIWQLISSPIWNVRYQGLPALPPEDLDTDFWVPEFYPRGGQELVLNFTRPVGTEGATLAIDSVDLSASVGKRSTDASLL